jgi:glycosyltransferase involved in cell wall biosynthesis
VSALRVVHLFADHKVTGPAELAVDTARALRARGIDASLYSRVVPVTPTRERTLQRLAAERGVPEAPIAGVVLAKHLSPARAALDAWRLRRFLSRERPDAVHCHLRNDHLVATLATGSAAAVPIVRTLYDGDPPARGLRRRLTFGPATRRLVCLSARVAHAIREDAAAWRLAPDQVVHLAPPVDVVRFAPGRLAPRRDALGVAPAAFCLGIVARMQTHRRFEMLLEAARLLRSRVPGFQLVIVGRGTHQDAVARDPVRRLGLADTVRFAGYVSGDDYAATLASFDAKVFLVPGSDGSCRAVREALAMGVPVIATRRGILPELVRDGIDGRLVDETPEALADAVEALARDRERLARMAAEARRGAVERFSFDRFAARLAEIYAEIAAPRAARPR